MRPETTIVPSGPDRVDTSAIEYPTLIPLFAASTALCSAAVNGRPSTVAPFTLATLTTCRPGIVLSAGYVNVPLLSVAGATQPPTLTPTPAPGLPASVTWA